MKSNFLGVTIQRDMENEIKLAQDVDLITNKTSFVVRISRVEKVSEQNYVRLTSTALGGDKGFTTAVSAFGCDLCHCESSVNNPIWTNASVQGIDICNTCIEKGFTRGWEPMPGWNPGPVYSLKALSQLIDMNNLVV